MTELSRKINANIFRRMANAEVMGWQVAAEAQSIVNFINDLEFDYYDTYVSKHFDSYVEQLVRGYQVNNGEYEDLSISTTHDLHMIEVKSLVLEDLIQSIKHKWEPRIYFARQNGLFN